MAYNQLLMEMHLTPCFYCVFPSSFNLYLQHLLEPILPIHFLWSLFEQHSSTLHPSRAVHRDFPSKDSNTTSQSLSGSSLPFQTKTSLGNWKVTRQLQHNRQSSRTTPLAYSRALGRQTSTFQPKSCRAVKRPKTWGLEEEHGPSSFTSRTRGGVEELVILMLDLWLWRVETISIYFDHWPNASEWGSSQPVGWNFPRLPFYIIPVRLLQAATPFQGKPAATCCRVGQDQKQHLHLPIHQIVPILLLSTLFKELVQKTYLEASLHLLGSSSSRLKSKSTLHLA